VRRECLDRVLIFGESHLRRVLASYAIYYNQARTPWRWARMRPWAGRSSGPVSLSPSQSCPACIINTSGYDFRKGQGHGHPRPTDLAWIATKCVCGALDWHRAPRVLDKDAPLGRAVQRSGAIVAIPILSGLYHHYVRT
jgi:hypothetical protein